MQDYIKYAAKACVALGAALAVVGTAVLPDSAGGASVTVQEWVSVGTALLAALGVYAVPNGAPPADGDHEL